MALAGLFIVLLMLSIPFRAPHIDDAWLGEHSYWLLQDGVAKSKLMTGIAHSDERLLLHHKLFTLQGAAVIKWLGFRLYVLKSVSLFYFLILMTMLYLIHRNRWFSEPRYFLLAALLLVSNPLIFEYSYVFRPEVMVAFLGLLSAWFVLQPESSNRYWLRAFAGGLTAGVAMATHLNGLIFIVTGGLYLLLKRNWGAASLFALGSMVTSLIYFYDFRSLDDFNYWFYQLNFVPSAEEHRGVFSSLFGKMADEQRRYLHSPKEIGFTVLLFSGLILSWKNLIQQRRGLLLYTFIIMISMSVMMLNKTSKYLILVIPFLILLFSSSYYFVQISGNRKRIRLLNSILGVYLIISLVYDVGIVRKKYDTAINAQITRAYAGDNAAKMYILAPMQFVFSEISHYKRIISLMAFNERQKIDPDLKGMVFLKAARQEDIDVILLPLHYQQKFDLGNYQVNDRVGDYRLVEKSDSLMVWKQYSLGYDHINERPPLHFQKNGLTYLGAID